MVAAIAATVLFIRQWRMHAVWLWIGALTILIFQYKSRADFDYWKHVNYALLFLFPLAAAGLIALAQRIEKDHYTQLMWGLCGVLALAGSVAWLGKVQNIDHFLFWPNTEPVLAFFEGLSHAQ